MLVNALTKSLVVLVLDKNLVDSLVDRRNILLLHGLQVVHDKGKVVSLADDLHYARMVDLLELKEKFVQLHRGILEIEGNGTTLVPEFAVANLSGSVTELVILPGCLRVFHHEVKSRIIVLGLKHEVARFLVQASLVTCAKHLGCVAAARVHLQVVHKGFGLVFRVEHGKLSEHTGVGGLKTKALLHEGEKLIDQTTAFVLGDKIFNVIRAGDNVQTSDTSKLGLASGQTSGRDLLPRLHRVCLASSIDSLLEETKLQVTAGQLGVVGCCVEEDLGSLEEALVEAAVTTGLNVGEVRGCDKGLELSKVTGTGVSKDEFAVKEAVLEFGAGHLEEAHQIGPLVLALSSLDNLLVPIGRVVSLDVAVDSIGDEVGIELCLGKVAPYLTLIAALGKLDTAIEVLHVVEQNIDGVHVKLALLEDFVGLLEELVLLRAGDLGNISSIKVVKTVDVIHHTTTVSLDGSEDEKVLKVAVVREFRTLKNNLFKELNQLVRELGGHERLDGERNLVRVLRLGESSLHGLVNNTAAVRVVVTENALPKTHVLALDAVTSLILKELVCVGDLNELIVAGAPGTLVGKEGKVRVELLTELTNLLGVVELVVLEPLCRVLVNGHVNLTNGIVSSDLSVSLSNALFKEGLEHAKAVALFDLAHELSHRAHVTNRLKQALDKGLVTVQVKELTDHLRGTLRGNLLHVNLNVLSKVLGVQVTGEFSNVSVAITDVDERARILHVLQKEELLDLFGIVVLGLTALADDSIELAHLGSSLDVLEVHIRVLRDMDNRATEVVKTLVRLVGLEELDEFRGPKLFGVLRRGLHDELKVGLDVVHHEDVETLNAVLPSKGTEEVHKKAS
mmetsp:Transcript_4546/g.9675  ORF Transcript_4546/g.9675 Transcript_4546/m.9675 type:complete len:847 (-) Transcript_4546:1224-3764(-)